MLIVMILVVYIKQWSTFHTVIFSHMFSTFLYLLKSGNVCSFFKKNQVIALAQAHQVFIKNEEHFLPLQLNKEVCLWRSPISKLCTVDLQIYVMFDLSVCELYESLKLYKVENVGWGY